MGKTQAQQIQFIRDCLFASNCLDVSAQDRCDGWRDYVDPELSLSENWANIVDEFGLFSEFNDWEERWRNIKGKTEYLREKYDGAKYLELECPKCGEEVGMLSIHVSTVCSSCGSHIILESGSE